MKTVVTYFSDAGIENYPFNDPDFRLGYQRLSDTCARHGVQLLFARTQESYLGKMTFAPTSHFEGDALVETTEPLTCDLIYMKSPAQALVSDTGDLVLNDPEFDALCRDKMETYRLFPDLIKKSVELTAENWQVAIAELQTDLIAFKPLYGEGGEGIIFKTKTEFSWDQLPLDEPYLAQEFTETIAGIPGLCEGRHDLRVVCINDTPIMSFARLAKEGNYRSNTAQGATVMQITLDQIPQVCRELITIIDQRLHHFPDRLYAIDFMFEDGIPTVTELNSRPGIPSSKLIGETQAQSFYEAVASLFAKLV